MAKPYPILKTPEIMINSRGWHVINVALGYEKSVHNQLKEMGIESLLPMFSFIEQKENRRKKVFKPLFPNYVFVNVKSESDFQNTLVAHGVSSYVRFGEEYGVISQMEIEEIKQFMEAQKHATLESSCVVNKLRNMITDFTGIVCEECAKSSQETCMKATSLGQESSLKETV